MVLARLHLTGQPMRRYFFDFVNPDQRQLDYQGQDLPTPERALRLAELIALDQAVTGPVGWHVAVCDADGTEYCSVPIHIIPELIAAA